MVNGIINVYKEKGYTSFDVVAKLRGIFSRRYSGRLNTSPVTGSISYSTRKRLVIQVHLIRMHRAFFLYALERQPECVTF